MPDRRRATRAGTLPEDNRELRTQTGQEWVKSARARGAYRPDVPDPFERAANERTGGNGLPVKKEEQ